jgi:hypothetical protein
VEVSEIAPGLWRWTAPGPGGEVSCTYYEGPDAVVLIDPALPADDLDAERVRRALDRDVARLGRPVAVLVTVEERAAAARAVGERYGAGPGPPPAGVVAVPAGPDGEVAYWLAEHRTLVARDLAGARTAAGDLPVERVLLAHGAPVLAEGRETLTSRLA